MSRSEAKELIETYYETYPTLKSYIAKQIDEPLKSIFAYHNMSGGVSGGTIESAFTMRDFKSKHKMGHPFLLNPKGSYSSSQKLLSKDYFSITKNKKLNILPTCCSENQLNINSCINSNSLKVLKRKSSLRVFSAIPSQKLLIMANSV